MIRASSMSTLFLNLTLSRNLQYHRPLYISVRKYAKRKKYDYNLNNLIDWKNKTNVVFGRPRTLTKKGKLRKSKNNENETLQNTMEILSAQSIYFSRNALGVNDDYMTPIIYNNGKNGTTGNCDTQQFDTQAPDFIDAYAQPYEGVNGNEMRVPLVETGPNDQSDNLQGHFSEDFCEKDIMPKYSKKRSNNRVAPEGNMTEGFIHTPVISPIPSNGCNAPKAYNANVVIKTTASEKKPVQRKKLPAEPPDSFSFIRRVPLCFSPSEIEKDINVHEKMKQFMTDVKSLSLRTVPSVKSILNKTMPDLNRFFLNRWREKMIAELGEEGFKVHQEATINRGINFHANVMELLSGKSESEIQIMPDNQGHWASLQTAVKHISGIHVLEEDMQHPALLYRGVADCVAKYKDVLCVIDWKTSKKPRPLLKNTYDDPLQVAAYIGLVSANRERLKIKEINHGLLVIIYPDGNPAHIHLMNKSVCEQFWQDWLERLYHYYQLVYTEKCGTG